MFGLCSAALFTSIIPKRYQLALWWLLLYFHLSLPLRDLQSGTLFTNITIGPYARKGLFFDQHETRSIIRHYVSMLNPTLPILDSPVKHLLVDMDELKRFDGGTSQNNINDWLAKRLSDIVIDTYYKFSGTLRLSTK